MKPRAAARSAFTLIELLTVVAIIILAAAFTIPAVNGILHGSQLSHAGDQTVAVLGFAKQSALALNHKVEVRFYQFGDPERPGENSAVPSSGKFRALQAFQIDDSGNRTALGKVETLPGSVMMDSGTNLSTLLMPSRSLPAKATDPPIPRAGTNYIYCSFTFLPDGSTDLAQTGTLWDVTLYGQTDVPAAGNLAAPPPNYITIQIDPVNSGLKIYRP